MIMSKSNQLIWKAIKIVCWLIFAGYCIQAGAVVFNVIFSFFRPAATQNLYLGLNLSDLRANSMGVYVALCLLLVVASALKATVFYLILQWLKALDLNKPFSEVISRGLLRLSILPLIIGILSAAIKHFAQALSSKGIVSTGLERFWNEGGAYIMMAAILFVMSLVFRKGAELQNENDLTV